MTPQEFSRDWRRDWERMDFRGAFWSFVGWWKWLAVAYIIGGCGLLLWHLFN